MLLCACAYGVKSESSQVRNFAWHRWFSFQRCCNVLFCLFLLISVMQNECVCMLWTSCPRAKIHYYYMWPFAKRLYHGWISTMASSNDFSWKLPPTKWIAGCASGYSQRFNKTCIFKFYAVCFWISYKQRFDTTCIFKFYAISE